MCYCLFPSIRLNRQSPANIEILVGTNDLAKGGQYFQVKSFVMHEDYNRPQFANDIAIVKLSESIEYNDKVQPISYDDEEVPDGAELQLTGWGRMRVRTNFFWRFQFFQ